MFNLLPLGVENPNTFNWNNLNTSGLNFYSPKTGLDWGSSWASSSSLTYSPAQAQATAINAANAGQTNKSKFWAGVVSYGPGLVAMASTLILALKGKKVSSANDITDDDAKAVLAYGNGTLNPELLAAMYKENGTQTRETEIFGIKTSTLILIGAGLLIYTMLKPAPSARRR